MGSLDWPYVKTERDRRGRVRYLYFRRNGRRWRLPDDHNSQSFVAEYQRLKAATDVAVPELGQYPHGSLGALALDYYASPEYRRLKPSSQNLYRLVIDPLVEKYGNDPVAVIERRHVKRWRDEKAETPGMANTLVKVVSLLLSYAVDNEYRKDNPAHRMKLYKLGEWRAWTEEECAAFEARWVPGTMERRCYMLAVCTGQRRSDLVKMTRADRVSGYIRVLQEKTGKELEIPELQQLTAELARGEQHIRLLTRPGGATFHDGPALGAWFAAAIEEAGLPEECVLHGLRKLTAKVLAEGGCSAHEIGAFTGHGPQSPEITRYTRQADQRKMATAAILKLETVRK